MRLPEKPRTIESEEEYARYKEIRERGEVLAVVILLDNDLSVEVFGPPDLRLADALDALAQGFRQACVHALAKNN